jgi:hypothetical protein
VSDKLDRHINGLLDLRPDWDSYGAEPPSAEVVEKLRNALDAIQAFLPPHHICPSAQGGAAFCWFRSPKYADIEFLNDGEIMAVTSTGTRTDGAIDVWEVGDVVEAARKISTWMYGEGLNGKV